MQQVIDSLYEDNDYSQETVQSYYNTFKQAIDDAVNDEILVTTKLNKVSYKKKNWKAPNKKIELSDLVEFMELASTNMRQDIYRCMYLLLFGLRRGEAYAITQNNITFMPNGLARIDIVLQRTKHYMEGKSVKSASSNRIIIVDKIMTGYLRDQIEYAKEIKATHNQTLHKDDFIFIHPTGLPYSEKTLNNAIDKVTKLMDEPIKLTPHMFRHTFATYASGLGVDTLQLQHFLGHASSSMTEHYSGSSEEAALNVLNKTKKLRDFKNLSANS